MVAGLAEGAEQRGGRLHRAQALALHVPDEDAGAVRAGLDVVEVAADPGVEVGGQVHPRVLQSCPVRRQRAQHGAAGRLGDVQDVQHLLFPAHPHGGGQRGQGAAERDQDEVGQSGLVLAGPGAVHDDVRHHRDQGEAGGGPHPADRGGDAGDQDDPGDDPEPLGGVEVQEHDGDEQHQGHHPGDAPPTDAQQLPPAPVLHLGHGGQPSIPSAKHGRDPVASGHFCSAGRLARPYPQVCPGKQGRGERGVLSWLKRHLHPAVCPSPRARP